MSQYSVEAILKATGAEQFAKAFENAGKSVEGLKSTSEGLGKVASGMMKGVTLPVLGIGTAVMAVGKQYEESMSSVQAISGATADEMDKLRSVAREMGATTRYSASEAADALGFMALAGWEVDEMTAALPGVLNLATAGQLDLAKASDIVTDMMSMFGMEAGDASKAADIFAAAQSKSNTNVEQLSEALLNAGPAAAAAGADLEQTSAILGVFANQGLKGGRAGTTLNAMFRDIKNSSEKGAIAIGKTKVAVYDASGEMRSMGDIMFEVQEATKNMTSEQRDAALAGVFQQQSLSGVNMLLAAGSDELAELEHALYDSKDTAMDMAAIMDDNLGGAMANMQSALEEVALGFFDVAGGPMTELVNKITGLIQWFGNLSGETKQWIAIAAGIAAAIGPVLWVIKKVMDVIIGMPAALALLSGPVGAIIAAVVAVIAIGALLIANWDKVKAAGQAMMDLLIPEFGLLMDAVKEVWETIKTAFSEGNFQEVARLFGNMVTMVIDEIAFGLPFLMEAGFDMISNIINGVAQKIPEFVQKGLELMVMFANILADNLPKLLRLGMEFVTSLIKGLADKLPEWIAKGVEMVVKIVGSIAQNLPKIIQAGGRMLVSAAQGFRDNFPAMLNAVAQLLANVLSSILSNLPKLLAAGVKLILSLAKGLLQSIPSVLKAIWDMGVGIVKGVNDINIFSAGKAIIDGFLRGLKSAWESVKSFVGGIAGWIAKNKGPISYDRKLLVGAGNAIMEGLDKGLQDSFRSVQRTVGGMAGSIYDTFNTSPVMDINGSIARSNAQVNSAVRHELGGAQLNRTDALLEQLLQKDSNVYLDGDVLVGGTYDRYDRQGGVQANYSGRWGLS